MNHGSMTLLGACSQNLSAPLSNLFIQASPKHPPSFLVSHKWARLLYQKLTGSLEEEQNYYLSLSSSSLRSSNSRFSNKRLSSLSSLPSLSLPCHTITCATIVIVYWVPWLPWATDSCDSVSDNIYNVSMFESNNMCGCSSFLTE